MKSAAQRLLACDAVVEETVATPISLPSFDDTKAIEHQLQPRPGWVISPVVFLHLQLQIRKRNVVSGELRPLELGDACAIVNFPHATIWRTAEISFGSYLITAPNAPHTYFSYLQALLTLPADYKRTYLAEAALWQPDSATNFDAFDVRRNEGYRRRSLPFVGDRVVELYAPLMFEIFRQPNPFPDDLVVTMKLIRNNHRFCINGLPEKDWTFELGILKADLCITRYRPVQRYRIGDLHFPIRGFASRVLVVPQGNASVSLDILEHAFVLPDHVGVGQLSQEAFNGSFAANAFNFQLYDVKQAHLLLDNATLLPPLGYQFETAGDGFAAFPARYLKAYVENMRAAPTGRPLESEPPINYDEFAGGSGILWWDLRNDRRTPGNASGARRGHAPISLRYVAEYWQPLAAPIVLLCFFFSERDIVLRQNGTVDVKA